MKNRFCAALLLAAFCVTLFTGCASVNALNHTNTPQDTAPRQSAESTLLTKEEAVSIALSHAELTQEQVSFLHTEFGYDDGRPEYDVDFHYDGWEYDYEIHAETGRILRSEREFADRKPAAPAATEPPVMPVTEPPATTAATAEGNRLSKEEARDIALQHAGLSAADVSRLKVEFDYDDGRAEYDVDFRHNGFEYDYEIHAETGKILKSEKERDD